MNASMPYLADAALIAAGLVLLVLGGELLVRGAASVARSMGISPLVVGITVVSFGTSAPELAVAVQAALSGSSDLALGNVVGSNIFNILVILGLCGIIAPIAITPALARREIPIMIAAAGLVPLFGLDGRIDRLEGTVLALLAVGYTGYLIRSNRSEPSLPGDSLSAPGLRPAAAMGAGIGGLVLLVGGSDLLVRGAVSVATSLGVPELIIGLTIVAVGTSLPEVAASVIATLRGEREIAVGNVVGSNIFNVLSVLGISAAITPVGVNDGLYLLDIPVMLGASGMLYLLVCVDRLLKRWEAALLFVLYLGYDLILVARATAFSSLGYLENLFLVGILPAVAALLLLSLISAFRSTRNPRT